jgi:hypothetical protein
MLRRIALGSIALVSLTCQSYTASAQNVFSSGQTGAAEDQLKAACPAFASGQYKLVATNASQSNFILSDVFEHETGARCACSRDKTVRGKNDQAMRCGPAASKRQ